MKRTYTAIKWITSKAETEATIWLNMWKKTIRPIIQQFIYKMIHGTHLVRKYWRNINSYEEWEICSTCNKMESMDHIMTQCSENSTHLIWDLAKDFWPHRNIPWPNVDLGTILGCGWINMQPEDLGNKVSGNKGKRSPTGAQPNSSKSSCLNQHTLYHCKVWRP